MKGNIGRHDDEEDFVLSGYLASTEEEYGTGHSSLVSGDMKREYAFPMKLTELKKERQSSTPCGKMLFNISDERAAEGRQLAASERSMLNVEMTDRGRPL